MPDSTPASGQMVLLRNRPGIVRDVQAATAPGGGDTIHLVDVEYVDGWRHPDSDRILWERERSPRVLTTLSLPRLDDPAARPDSPDRFEAFLDAIRWTAVARLPRPGEDPNTPGQLLSPWHGAVQVEDYQLYPVLKALAMPRVTLLLADDVGLGKTIEAGLIAAELIARRRIRRILVLCPASLQIQWRDEMREKFNLDFTVINRDEVQRIQRSLGMDANPWSSTPRVITSMDYLRQADVLQSFLSSTQGLQQAGSPTLPWDLLIVDEAHNLAPSTFGDDSQRCRMLREISAQFEHRLFLTATPHNGYTPSFTGLLELLDPVRFQQRATITAADQTHIGTVMVRRLKSELNARRGPPRFGQRTVEAIPHPLSPTEKALADALRAYREAGLSLVGTLGKRERNLGRFLWGLLTKRLLSSSYAFACTWLEHVRGFDLSGFGIEEAEHARERAEAQMEDDTESDRRAQDAARHAAAWLRGHSVALSPHVRRVDAALAALGWTPQATAAGPSSLRQPPPDAKCDAFLKWVDGHLRQGKGLRRDERLILFTEYKDTLDYLLWRLAQVELAAPEVQSLFGGAPSGQREAIKDLFTDPESPLRILVATDAASEGLNLQTTCRYVIHQEIPWNPMRLEQRNGRVDRHGQARNVAVFHFVSGDDADTAFLAFVARKVESVREDLGSAGQVIDEAIMEHFGGHRMAAADLNRRLEQVRQTGTDRTDVDHRDAGRGDAYARALQALRTTELRLGLHPQRMARVLDQAVRMEDPAAAGLTAIGDTSAYRLVAPPAWNTLVGDTLRIRQGAQEGAMPRLVFDPTYFEEDVSGRRLFRPRRDAVLMRLGHPVMRRAMAALKRQMWSDTGLGGLQRWTLTATALPPGPRAVLVTHALLTATNDLREVVHNELIRLAFLVDGATLTRVEPDLWQEVEHLPVHPLPATAVDRWTATIAGQWAEFADQLGGFLAAERDLYQDTFHHQLAALATGELARERKVYAERLRELDADHQRSPAALQRLQRELAKAELQRAQITFDEERNQQARARVRELQQTLQAAEWEQQHSHLELLRRRLERDRDRLLTQVLPRRFRLAQVDLQPVAVEFRVRADAAGGPR